MILITIIIGLLQLMPIEGYFNNYEKMSPALIESGLREMGLKDPLYVQVGRYLKNLLQGDLGVSRRYRVNAPITDIIMPKMAVSMKVGLISMAVSLPLGMALGALMARSKGRFADKLGNAYIVFIRGAKRGVFYLHTALRFKLVLTSVCSISRRMDEFDPSGHLIGIAFHLQLCNVAQALHGG